jgi:hypothetical protein
VIYAPAGNRAAERLALRTLLHKHIRPSRDCLTLVAGDFNFVEHQCDRHHLASGADTGSADGAEAKRWQDTWETHGLREVWQGGHTHRTSQGSSRLDRLYGNFHAAEQLDRDFFAALGRHRADLSAHAPLVAGCRHKVRQENTAPRMLDRVVQDSRFAQAARTAYSDRLFSTRDAATAAHPLGRLRLLKHALWEAHTSVAAAGNTAPAPPACAGGTAMRCL